MPLVKEEKLWSCRQCKQPIAIYRSKKGMKVKVDVERVSDGVYQYEWHHFHSISCVGAVVNKGEKHVAES